LNAKLNEHGERVARVSQSDLFGVLTQKMEIREDVADSSVLFHLAVRSFLSPAADAFIDR